MPNCSSFIPFSLILFLSPVPSHSKTPPINVWPKPQKVSWPTPKATTFSPRFKILSPPPLRPAVDRYSRLIPSERYYPVTTPSVELPLSQPLVSLTVSVSDLSCPLRRHGVDESYTLLISSGTANLTARTAWGAKHGLETFSQLTWGEPAVVATDISIYDRPNFSHRGIVLDTSRNYYPKEDILRSIDAMAANKLNVFRWHITDSQSFPIVLPSVPELAEKGSYGRG